MIRIRLVVAVASLMLAGCAYARAPFNWGSVPSTAAARGTSYIAGPVYGYDLRTDTAPAWSIVNGTATFRAVTGLAGLADMYVETHGAAIAASTAAARADIGVLQSTVAAQASTLLQLSVDTTTLAGLVGGVDYFTVSPSTGIDSGVLAAGVKIRTANVQATGEPSATTYWRGDGAWAEVAQSTATYWQTSTIDTAADFGAGTGVNIDTVTTEGSIAMVPQIEQTAYEAITGNLTSLYRYRQPIIPEHTTTVNGLALKTNRDTATQTLKVSICDSAMDVLVSSIAPIVPNINIDYPSTTLAAYTTYYIVIETVTIDTYWNFRHTSSEPYSPSNLQYADYAGGEWADSGAGHDIYFVLQSTAGLYTTSIIDGSSLWSDWGLFTTNDSAPEGSAISYYVKTSTYSEGLASAVPVEITSGSAIASLVGPYAQLIVDLSRSDSAVDPIVNRLDTLYCADGSVKLTGANMTGPLSATTLTGTHYGDGSNLTGLAGGGDMVASVHGVAIAAATTTIAGQIITSHAGLSSTGTLTHAALESTLTAVTAATTTLKSVSDAQAATLVQVGVDTQTLAGLVGSGAGDNLGNHVATTTLDMGFNNISNLSVITSTADVTIQTQFNYAYPFGGIKLRGNSYGMSQRGIDIDNEGAVTMGPTVFGNTVDFNYWVRFSSRGFISDRLPFRMNQGDTDTIVLVRNGGYGIFTGSVTASEFYGSGEHLTDLPAASIPASISVDTITVGGTPALNGYPVSINGDVLVSSGVMYLRNSQLLMAHPDGETSVYLLSTDSDSYNADILMQSGSTLTVTGSGGTKSHYVQNGNITADYIYGNGSQLTGLAGGDMTVAVHGVAIAASTATLRTDVTALQQSTGTLLTMFTGVGASTATLRTDVTTAQSALTKVGASTATLRTDITTLQTSTGTLKTQITAIGTSTGTIKTQITSIGTSTATLRTDLTAVKQSTGVTITSNWITLGATQTYVTTLSTRIACGLQTQPFTISSATARVNGGTSATLRLFITDKNTEFNISAATPIWNTGVVAGTAHTGGTMSNVSVAANQSITAVIDGISGAVVDIILWVRGTR